MEINYNFRCVVNSRIDKITKGGVKGASDAAWEIAQGDFLFKQWVESYNGKPSNERDKSLNSLAYFLMAIDKGVNIKPLQKERYFIKTKEQNRYKDVFNHVQGMRGFSITGNELHKRKLHATKIITYTKKNKMGNVWCKTTFIKWAYITAEWNKKHPDDIMTVKQLQNAYNRSLPHYEDDYLNGIISNYCKIDKRAKDMNAIMSVYLDTHFPQRQNCSTISELFTLMSAYSNDELFAIFKGIDILLDEYCKKEHIDQRMGNYTGTKEQLHHRVKTAQDMVVQIAQGKSLTEEQEKEKKIILGEYKNLEDLLKDLEWDFKLSISKPPKKLMDRFKSSLAKYKKHIQEHVEYLKQIDSPISEYELRKQYNQDLAKAFGDVANGNIK